MRALTSLLIAASFLAGCSDPTSTPAGGAGGSAAAAGSAGSAAAAGSAGSAAGSGGSATAGSSSGGSAGNNSGGEGGGLGGSGNAGGGGQAGANFEPYFFDDFDGYSDGASLSDNKPFDAAGHTTASSEAAFSGSQSARMEIRDTDQGGFGKWGGVLPINPALTKGQEVWVRLRVRWPASFQFTASPWMKFLRLHTTQADGSNAGYNDLYVDQADSTTSVLRTIKEIHDVWAVFDGPKIPRDTWESYEMYLFIDNESVDAGGAGRVRIWRDNALIFNRTDVPTIVAAESTVDYFYLFTYWNNEAPPNNHCYVDDLVIATGSSPPPNRDADGNAFVGDWAPN